MLGLLTLGLGWSLFAILGPAVALVYVWNTLGGRNQATVGMRMMGIRLDRLDGRPVDGLLAVVHSVLFWAGNVVLTPLILLVTLFADRKRAAARPAARHGGHPLRPLSRGSFLNHSCGLTKKRERRIHDAHNPVEIFATSFKVERFARSRIPRAR